MGLEGKKEKKRKEKKRKEKKEKVWDSPLKIFILLTKKSLLALDVLEVKEFWVFFHASFHMCHLTTVSGMITQTCSLVNFFSFLNKNRQSLRRCLWDGREAV